MHFRVRKNVIQLIRIRYDGAKKKGSNTIVGTVKLAKPELSGELREALTSSEADEFCRWVETKHRADRLREELTALSLAETLAQAARWFENEGDSVAARAAATDIVFQWQALRRVFIKNNLVTTQVGLTT